MRLNKTRGLLEEKGLHALVVNSPSNIYYLSGFTGTNATLFITLENSYLLTDFRYLEQAAKEAESFEIIRVDNEVFVTLSELAKGLKIIGIEEDYMTWAEYRKMREAFLEYTLADASDILREMREIKDNFEVDIIRQAVRITDETFDSILNKIRIGTSEEEIAFDLEYSLRKKGASGRSFDYIVASGKRSALPHGVATEKVIRKGELIILDFGAKYQWYCSDLTRTVFVGEPDDKHKEIYHLVQEAQQATLDIMKPGMSGKEVDAIAREIISGQGYGQYFGHGLGHSVGLEIHESPRLNTIENKILEPGMVITVEPGIYIPGWGGVRIEDMVLVTKNGVEVLTHAPKQFIIIE